MNLLTAVSETALITLKARVLESNSPQPTLDDPVAAEALKQLQALLPTDLQQRLLNRTYPPALTRHIALRARRFDRYAQAFIQENPLGLVVSVGSGFDTRYWRVSKQSWRYVEVDLPAITAAKQAILGHKINYETISDSVLADAWWQRLLDIQREKVLFLAEGLLMYLPPNEVRHLFRKLTRAFTHSYLVCELVNARYTQGRWQQMVAAKMKHRLGTQDDALFQYGVRRASEIEGYSEGLRVVEEWSHLEEPEVVPAFLKLLRGWPLFSRAQWVAKIAINVGEG